MDGIELKKNMIEQGISIPIIMGSTEEGYKIGRTGVDSSRYVYLVKPTSPEALIKFIEMLLKC